MKRVVIAVIPAAILGVLIMTWLLWGKQGQAAKDYQAAYAPEQPIAFSHEIHAGQNEIPCQYCHIYARRSRSSGVPPVSLCMNCHKVVGAGKPEVEKLKEYWNTQKPIEWVKVHDNPDFVRYTHRVHIKAGEELAQAGYEGFTCQNCHGPVEKMQAAVLRDWDPVLENKPLSMGWCLTCHRNNAEPVANLRKLKKTAQEQNVDWETLVGQIKATEQEVEQTKAQLRDCLTCHY